MSQRIKELWEDSDEITVSYPEQGSPVSVSEQTLKKFAELIVMECASINYNSPFQDGEFHARAVLEHFGV